MVLSVLFSTYLEEPLRDKWHTGFLYGPVVLPLDQPSLSTRWRNSDLPRHRHHPFLMHGSASGYALTYLLDAFMPLSTLPGRAHLWSAHSGQYDVPQVSSLAGSRAFSVAGPKAWNQLPASLHQTNFVLTFKRHLKTILFTAAYGVTDN